MHNSSFVGIFLNLSYTPLLSLCFSVYFLPEAMEKEERAAAQLPAGRRSRRQPSSSPLIPPDPFSHPKTQPTLSSTRPTWQRWTHPSAGETVAFTTFLLPLLLCFTRSPWPPWPSQLASPSYKTSSPRPRVPPPPSFPLRAAATGKGHPRTCFPASRSHGRLGHDLAAGLSLRRGLPSVVFSLDNTAPDPF